MVREWSIERDDRLIKELYPEAARKILPYVEAECDRMEYNGSRMYDEFPDKYMMRRLNHRIYDRMQEDMDEPQQFYMGIPDETADGSNVLKNLYPENKKPEEIFADDEIFATGLGDKSRGDQRNRYLEDLIDVLMYHEMFSRRCRHNQCKCCRAQGNCK